MLNAMQIAAARHSLLALRLVELARASGLLDLMA